MRGKDLETRTRALERFANIATATRRRVHIERELPLKDDYRDLVHGLPTPA